MMKQAVFFNSAEVRQDEHKLQTYAASYKIRRNFMNISLTSELEDWAEKQIGSGFCRSASEIVREALFVFRDYDHLRRSRPEKLRQQIEIGLNQAGSGQIFPFNEDVLRRVREQGREKMHIMIADWQSPPLL
jgi:putative addiction module CopG family antidote